MASEAYVKRPSVSVVVPFLGLRSEAEAALHALTTLPLGPSDELVMVDNTAAGALRGLEGAHIAAAPDQRSAYYARNVGVEHSCGEWLLFLDADCRAPAGLIDAYFRARRPRSCGAVAGAVEGAPHQTGLIPRYARSRRHLNQEDQFRQSRRPAAVTANLLVRREAFDGVGGFLEGVRSGADTDFCWRIQQAGWSLAYEPAARVEHLHRDSVVSLARQAARDGAGRAWVNRRHHRALGRPRVARGLARCVGGAAAWSLRREPERALFKAIDAVVIAASGAGYLGSNAARSRPSGLPHRAGALRLVVLADLFPVLSETFVSEEVHALQRAGHAVRVEATARPEQPNRMAGRGLRVHYVEDEGIGSRLVQLCWLVVRHPRRGLADLAARPRWRREEAVKPLRALAPRARRLTRSGERHLHAHFAGHSALDGLRLGRLLDLPYSVTAHAHDIFQVPCNLPEKLGGAAFVTTGCEYNVRHLRGVIPEHAHRIHEIVMGVDGGRFRRRSEHPGGRSVVAVGRLVEQKGFRYLVEAAARLEARAPLERLTILGAGPLERALREAAEELALNGRLELRGAGDPDEVRELLERADLLAMPCVVASDGNRDSMPVVVKEALAMEVPVVASDEVGLPELVRPEWGRLVPPRDPAALAEAIEELLALPLQDRRRMGRAGREWVLRHCNVDIETERLAGLVREAGGG